MLLTFAKKISKTVHLSKKALRQTRKREMGFGAFGFWRPNKQTLGECRNAKTVLSD